MICDHLIMYVQGGHIFERLNSLRFPGYFQIFPEQLKGKNSMEYIFGGSYVTYFYFP